MDYKDNTTDFTVQFGQLIDGCTCFELESAQIPNLFYNITAANQWINFNDGTASVLAQLAMGIYSLAGNTVSALILSKVGTAMTLASLKEENSHWIELHLEVNFLLSNSLHLC